jgi:hypothetical protein
VRSGTSSRAFRSVLRSKPIADLHRTWPKYIHRAGTSAAITREKSSPPGTEQRDAAGPPTWSRDRTNGGGAPGAPARYPPSPRAPAAAGPRLRTAVKCVSRARGQRDPCRAAEVEPTVTRKPRTSRQGRSRARGARWLLAPCVSHPSVRPTSNAELSGVVWRGDSLEQANQAGVQRASAFLGREMRREIPQARRLRRLDAVAGKIHHCQL